jgi:hypothetical protein
MRPTSKTPKHILRERIKNDPEAASIEKAVEHMQPEDFKVVHFDVDPLMVEQAGAGELVQLTIRLGKESTHMAQMVADRDGVKYQKVIRRWVAQCARQERENFDGNKFSRSPHPITSPHPTEDPRGHGR